MPCSLMLDEIRQQPATLRRTIEGGVKTVFELRRRFEQKRPRLVVLAARGSSDNAARFGRYLIEVTTGIPVSLAAPSALTLYGRAPDYGGALIVGISQSGESTDINALLAHAHLSGAETLGITNESGSALARIAGCVLPVCAGKEESVAATKTYTGQIAAFYLLAYALGAPIGLDELPAMADCAEKALELESEIREAAECYRSMTRAVCIGRGLNYCNAHELGLKLMETCYVSADRFSAADLMHGPLAIVEESFPAFVFAAAGVTWPSLRELIARLGNLNAEVLVFSGIPPRETRSLPGRFISVALPENADIYSPVPLIVPAQLFAAHLAAAKGLNPDRPRSLGKVTLTM